MIHLLLALALALPTGVRLDPAGQAIAVGNMPLAMALAPDGRHLVLLLSGWRQQGLQVVDLDSGAIVQTVEKNATFLGLAFAPDGKTLFASGGNDNVVYVFDWADGRLGDSRTIAGLKFPAGIALSPDGKTLYVAENMADDLAVIDVASMQVTKRLATEHYPYAVVADAEHVYVSAWGGESVSAFPGGRIRVGRHPSALALRGDRLYVALASEDRIAVVDTKRRRVIRTLVDTPPQGPQEGSTPNALALSADGRKLYVAEADNNAVAFFEDGKLRGRIPTDWYPAAVMERGRPAPAPGRRAGRPRSDLIILNAKGAGTRPNPGGPTPDKPLGKNPQYTLAMIDGSVRIVPLPIGDLSAMTKRVALANHWSAPRGTPPYPPFKHVVYIIKENRTYDQILGDLEQGDGDPSLLFFGQTVSPNHHALAERFGLFDRFFTNAEVSSQGHIWSTAAYVTDYGEKTIPSLYANKRPEVEEGDVDEPAEGFLWNRALEKGVSLRVYGEFAQLDEKTKTYRSTKVPLVPDTSPDYPSFDMSIPDQKRADVWIAELQEHVRAGAMPALEILHLPNDHTAGGRANRCTPRSCMADNDLALGRIIEALSQTPFWRDTVVFVVEDDAQDGADHVDSHRAPFFVVSAYSRPGVRHRFVNTTDAVAAIGAILGLRPLSQFDHYARPLAEVFATTPDLTPYHAMTPAVPLDEKNPETGAAAKKSAALDLRTPDAIDDRLFNEILWEMLKGHD